MGISSFALWKYMGIGAFVVLAVIHIVLATMGVGNVLGSLIIILLCYLLSSAVLRLTFRVFNGNPELFLNIRLLLKVLVILWVCAELFFRFGPATYESYGEKNGSWLYISPYLVKENSWSGLWVENEHVYQANLSKQYSFEEYDYSLNTNSYGLRNEEIEKQKARGVYRIIALGDSFTEGRGATQDESWPAVLNSALGEGITNQTFEVVNAGISGSDPFFELHLLKNKLLELQPDMVIMAINSSDIDDIVIRGGSERFDNDGKLSYKKGPWWAGIYANSYLFRHIIHDVFEYNLLFNKTDTQTTIRDNAKANVHKAIHAFIEMAKEERFRPMVLFHPLLSEFDKGETELDHIFESVRKDSTVLTLNILKNLEVTPTSGNQREDFYWPIDQHHTPAGYKMMVNEIYDAMYYAEVFE
ncbi:MAG: hypothetical protein JKY18_08855 [Flavobacteriales bacterium]|nr:hypothetical protein [Flavobacteriales bacterium]